MRTLRDFLLAESVLREGQEDNNKTKNKSDDAPPVPDGYSRASISGRISKTGLALLKNYTGDESVKYSDVKLSDISVKNIKSKFIGKNFVFDNRLGERITDDIISNCHICKEPCDNHTDCKNDACHILFIQCDSCSNLFNGCCSKDCQNFIKLPFRKQKIYRKDPSKIVSKTFFDSRAKPKLVQE